MKAHSRGWLIGIGVTLCLVVAVVGAIRWPRQRTGACDSMPVSVASATEGQQTRSISAVDVLVYEGISSSQSGWAGASVIVGDDGRVIAFDKTSHWPEVSYRIALASPESVDAIRRCVDSDAFRDLSDAYTSENRDWESGRFCAIADAPMSVISSGPASGGPKTVTAYALDQQDSCDLGTPSSLDDLHRALGRLGAQVTAVGVTTDPPSADLTPI